jgi:nucleoside-diphosphate-sugar epimerase
MKVLITGGAGFLGLRLARALLARGHLTGPDGAATPIDKIVLLDAVAPAGLTDARLQIVTGDFAQPSLLAAALDGDTHAVFHLAAVVSGQAEADFDLGMRINLDGPRHLLERCRALGHRPRVVFTSSVAVYGGTLPDVVPEDTALNPQSSYGAQKAIGELLLGDYSRKGFIDGRVLRLPTVSVRPGRPNAAASSFASGIIREPLHGESAVCPVSPETRLWLLSPRGAIDSLIAGYELAPEALGNRRSLNLPGISITAGAMVEALARVAGPEVAALVRWEHDPRIDNIVSTWPAALDAQRAISLGMRPEGDFDTIIRAYMQDELPPPQ